MRAAARVCASTTLRNIISPDDWPAPPHSLRHEDERLVLVGVSSALIRSSQGPRPSPSPPSRMATAPGPVGSSASCKAGALWAKQQPSKRTHVFSLAIRASTESRNVSVFKELGLYSLKKKIEDTVNQVEMITPTALELEEARRIRHEEVLHEYNLWDDLVRSHESLAALADAIKVVDNLKDLRYKAEEAKLITQLAEMDIINDQLFKQAYLASLDASKFLERYEISKLLNGPYDKEGACVAIKAVSGSIVSEVWAERLLLMYVKWAEKHGYKGRTLDKCSAMTGGIRSVMIEFESEYVYGYLSGEKGTHMMICHTLDDSEVHEACLASVDVIPIFLDRSPDLHIDDKDLDISSSTCEDQQSSGISDPAVIIRHVPSGITFQSSAERSRFANKVKALNRLKSKLLVLAAEQDISDVNRLKKDNAENEQKREVRKYMVRPHKLVHDMRTGIQLPDLNSVLDGNIDPLIRSHVCLRTGMEMIG